MTHSLISVIVVTFNSQSTLPYCLRSIPSGAEVIVVDQNSSDGSAELAGQLRPHAKVIRAGVNRGFGAGCNLGAANATGSVLIFLNPDAYLESVALDRLAETVISRNALVGPKIIDANGQQTVSARYRSRMLTDLAAEILPYRFARGFFARDIPLDDAVYRDGGPVGYIYGSCMAVSAENFGHSGGFDERYFLYHEEEVLARRLGAVGVRVLLEPRAVTTHIGKVSTSQAPYFAVGQQYRSRALYYSTYSPRRSSRIFCYTLWSLLRIMEWTSPVRGVVGFRAGQDRLWYRSAAAGIVSGRKQRMVQAPSTNQTAP